MARRKNEAPKVSRKAAKRARDDDAFHLEPSKRVVRLEFDDDEELTEFQNIWDADEAPEETSPSEKETFLERVYEKRYRPHHRAPIFDIEFEVDHLHETRAGLQPGRLSGKPRDMTPRHDRTVYQTERGRVSEAYAPSEHGERRVLYVKGEGALSERRFSSHLVDEIVKDVRLDEDEVVTETVTEYVPADQAKAPKKKAKKQKKAKPAKKPKPTKKPKKGKATKTGAPALAAKKAERAKTEGWDPDQAPALAAGTKDYQPQCAAIAASGVQCRNSAREGSKYCGSHKGFHPKTLGGVVASKDTKPRVEAAEDTLPTKEGKQGADHQPQCAAITAAGSQCRNSARKSSKYCGSHKGFRPQSIGKGLDTKPRVAKAKDTKPTLRKK